MLIQQDCNIYYKRPRVLDGIRPSDDPFLNFERTGATAEICSDPRQNSLCSQIEVPGDLVWFARGRSILPVSQSILLGYTVNNWTALNKMRFDSRTAVNIIDDSICRHGGKYSKS